MGCECNLPAKILCGIASVLMLVGVIIMTVSGVSGGKGFEIDFNPKNAKNPTVKTESGKGDLGYCLHFKASEHSNCASLVAQTTCKSPSNTDIVVDDWCFYQQEEWEKEHDPPLRKLARFYLKDNAGVKEHGNYQITSPTNLWVRDLGAEIDEAASGIFAALGLFIFGVIVCIIADILFCVGCCCMAAGKPTQVQVVSAQPTVLQVVSAQPGVQVVGQPISASK